MDAGARGSDEMLPRNGINLTDDAGSMDAGAMDSDDMMEAGAFDSDELKLFRDLTDEVDYGTNGMKDTMKDKVCPPTRYGINDVTEDKQQAMLRDLKRAMSRAR